MPKPYFRSRSEEIAEIIRVNQAGEYAASVIYQTQIKYTADHKAKQLLQEMLLEEKKHLDFFNDQIKLRKVRPSMLIHLWHILAFQLAIFSTILGTKYMMIATDSVEEVIQEHYQKQLDTLNLLGDEILTQKITQFRLEELAHQSIANKHIKDSNLFEACFAKIISIGCRTAISIAKKL